MSKGHDFFSEQLEDLKRKTQEQQALRKQNDPAIAIERELQEAEGRNELLAKIGERIKPKFHSYVSSFAVHIYKDANSSNGEIITQITGIENLPEALAQHMIRELTLHVSRKYGRKPQAKRGEDLSYKNDGKILQVEAPKIIS